MTNSRTNVEDKAFSVLVNNAAWGSASPRIWSLWLSKIPTRTLHEILYLLTARWFWRGSYCLYRWGNSNRKKPVISERTCQSLLRRCRLLFGSVAVLGNICSKLVRNMFYFFFRIRHSFTWFPNEIRPTFLITGTARTRVRHTFMCLTIKRLLWFLESLQQVRACSLSAPVQWTRVRSDKTVTQIAINTYYKFFCTAYCKFRCLCNKRRSICEWWETSHCRISRLISVRA